MRRQEKPGNDKKESRKLRSEYRPHFPLSAPFPFYRLVFHLSGCYTRSRRFELRGGLAMKNRVFRFVYNLVNLRFLHRSLRAPALLLLGTILGLSVLLVHISRATSYLSDSPETCMNCHVMTDAYISWQHSSHGKDATCNDCHVPHTSVPREYAFKAHDGLYHAGIFTLRMEPQSIKLSSGAIPVVQENCLRCHEERLSEVSACRYESGDMRCWDCHREVPHGRVRSLSASPNRFRPELPHVIQENKF